MHDIKRAGVAKQVTVTVGGSRVTVYKPMSEVTVTVNKPLVAESVVVETAIVTETVRVAPQHAKEANLEI